LVQHRRGETLGGASGEDGYRDRRHGREGKLKGNGGAYQSSGVGAINAEQGDGRADFLGPGGIGPQAVDGGCARSGELLGGTQASAGEASGHHCAIGREKSLGEGGEKVVDGDTDVRSASSSRMQVETRSDFFPDHVVPRPS
jgi:hypothetical protein